SNQRMSVLLYDKADMVPSGSGATSEPAFVDSVGSFSVANGTRHVYRVNVSGAQGALVRFPDLPVGATINVRVTGSQGAHPIEKIEEATLVHADLFGEGGNAVTATFLQRT